MRTEHTPREIVEAIRAEVGPNIGIANVVPYPMHDSEHGMSIEWEADLLCEDGKKVGTATVPDPYPAPDIAWF